MATLSINVPNMACSACVENITKAVHAIDSDATLQTDLKTKAVNIETAADPATIQAAITDAGYTIAA